MSQLDLFAAPPPRSAPPPPSIQGAEAITGDPFRALAILTAIERADAGVAVGPVGWNEAAEVYYALLAEWRAQPSPRGPLPGPRGIVLAHLQRLAIFAEGPRSDGAWTVPTAIFDAAKAAVPGSDADG